MHRVCRYRLYSQTTFKRYTNCRRRTLCRKAAYIDEDVMTAIINLDTALSSLALAPSGRAINHQLWPWQLLRLAYTHTMAGEDFQEYRWTDLHTAAVSGDTSLLPQLMTNTPVDAADEFGRTPLLYAALNGHATVIKHLIRAGALKSKAHMHGQTPLHVAAAVGATAVVDILMSAGAPVAVADMWGRTPLHYAAQQGQDNAACVQLLLDHGANVAAADESGETPLHLAARTCAAPAVDVLLQAGADIDAACRQGRTPLHLAAEGGSADFVQHLLDAGAGMNIADAAGLMPLHVAASRDHAAVLLLLVHAGAEVSATCLQGRTALHAAAATGSDKAAAALLAAHAPFDVVDYSGATPLALAAANVRALAVKHRLTAAQQQRQQQPQQPQQQQESQQQECFAEQQQQQNKQDSQQEQGQQPSVADRQPDETLSEEQTVQQKQRQLQQPDQQQEEVAEHIPKEQDHSPAAQQQRSPAMYTPEQSACNSGVWALMHGIKAEPVLQELLPWATAADADRAGNAARGAAAAAAGGSSAGLPGPAAMQLLARTAAAGLYLPNQQQRDYYLLADQPFSSDELLQLHGHYLAPMTVIKDVGRSNCSGRVREAQRVQPVGHSRVQHVYPSLAAAVLKLSQAEPLQQLPAVFAEWQRQKDQAQQKRSKKRQRTTGAVSAAAAAANAAAAAVEATDEARLLLLVLRALRMWEGRQVQEKELPLLLQLLLFGGPQPGVQGVIEAVDLLSDEESEVLNRQLKEGAAELLFVKEVEGTQQEEQGCGGMPCRGDFKAAVAVSGVKREHEG